MSLTDPSPAVLAALQRKAEVARATACDVSALADDLRAQLAALPARVCTAWRSAASDQYDRRLDELYAAFASTVGALDWGAGALRATERRLEHEIESRRGRVAAWGARWLTAWCRAAGRSPSRRTSSSPKRTGSG